METTLQCERKTKPHAIWFSIFQAPFQAHCDLDDQIRLPKTHLCPNPNMPSVPIEHCCVTPRTSTSSASPVERSSSFKLACWVNLYQSVSSIYKSSWGDWNIT